MRSEVISLPAPDGTPIPTIIQHAERPRAFAVLVHGIFSSKDEGGRFIRQAEMLAGDGISSLRFDQRCHGDSTADRRSISVLKHIEDLDYVLSYSRRFGLPLDLIASSYGAAVALLLAQRNEGLEVERCVLLNPVVDFFSTFVEPLGAQIAEVLTVEKRNRLTTNGYADLVNGVAFTSDFWSELILLHPEHGIPLLPQQSLVLHGDRDTAVSFDLTRATFARFPSIRFAVIRGSDHAFMTPEAEAKSFELIRAFLVPGDAP